MHKYTVAAMALAALIVVQSAAAQRPVGYAEEVLHKHSMPYQRRNSKSMSFIENFFPHSRSAKVSNAFNESKTNQTESTSSISISTEETTNPIPISTQDEGRATGSTRKTTQTTKRKSSSTRNSSSTTPKTTKHTQKATTTKPMTSNTPKTTHKQYTIYPSTMIKTNPSSASTSYKPKTESTTTKITTKAVTLAELAKVTESATTKLSTTKIGTTLSESSTDLDGREGELELKEKQQLAESKNETVSLPAVLAKPTKYHYYPHNQHIYLLPECAIQQVCNAVYVRLNYTQPLCACPARYRDPCSASLNADDLHTTLLTTDSKKKYSQKAVTLVKTCEATSEMRECRAPRDWSLLALQNIRTGKSHYLVICKCSEEFVLEGPMSHDQPTYASVPGIRVYGMMCVQQQKTQYSSIGHSSRPTTSSYKVGYSQPHHNQDQTFNRYPGYIGPGVYYNRMARKIRERRSASEQLPPFPWEKARELALTADWEN